MKDFLDIDAFFRSLKQKKLTSFLDKVSFANILIFWIFAIILFGFIYYFFSGSNSFLLYVAKETPVNSVTDSLYFSFVSATTTGFGDIIPTGSFKLIAILEVISGLLLLALVTSKLVSIKQDAILNELYDLSFTERINKLRSSLLLFRQNLDRMITKVEDGSIRRREIISMYNFISPLEDSLRETFALINKSDDSIFVKNIDSVNTELIFNSIISSFEKIYELLSSMNEAKLTWKSETITNMIETCLSSTQNLFDVLSSSIKLRKEKINDLNARKSDVFHRIKDELNKNNPPPPTENKPPAQQ
ncbi:two pore domain potassium channel family protein [Candidatus Woesearchaeota archaeon]|nr:two pore domain potassium channel family protein [Candidatus Woesearchaeota archaeon]